MRLSRYIFLIPVLLLVACGDSPNGVAPATGGHISVDNVTADLTLPTTTGAVYLRIINGSDADDALVDAEIPGCGEVELHQMSMEGDVMMMHQVEGNRVPLPAGETVLLERGGLHMMCLEKTGEYTVGQNVPITLQFENAGPIRVEAEIVAPGETTTDMDGNE